MMTGRRERGIPYLRLKIRLIVVLGLITLILGIVYFLLIHFQVKTVYVEGNKHYSAEEIREKIMTGYLGDNSLFLSLKYSNREIKDIPFVETMDVIIESNDTIRIKVYEKSIAGYVEYLGSYMYFDNDGVVIESTKIPTIGVPQVTGLDFDYIVLYEKLPIDNTTIFQNILTITKLLNKYELEVQKIQFDKNYNVILGYGKVKVLLGKMENLDDKLMQLPGILPSLEGQSGTLNLQNYSSDKKSITFEKDVAG
ncbi:MAG: FtsQ-type POTRA domain-containing protein [Lachnospiraceae bacterium]|nr:FtsQ-type POTRA domain-containing protein [Lachnospiraceae bacterium]